MINASTVRQNGPNGFDGRTKNNSLLIRNTSNKNLDFKLVVTHKDMTEEGALIDVTPQQVEGRSDQWSTAPEGPHQLLIPVEKKETFLTKVEKNRGKGMKVARYKVLLRCSLC